MASSALCGGIVAFVGASVAEILLTQWRVSLGSLLAWGQTMMVVRAQEPALFWTLFAVHAVSLATVSAVAHGLFRHVALARGGRVLVTAAVGGLSAIDVLSWVLLGRVGIAQALVGPAVAVLAVVLTGLAGKALAEMWFFARLKPRPEKTRIVVVGGGFAGLYAALGLDGRVGYHPGIEIVVLDRNNYFLFPPLLPSVAAGAIETRQVTYPFRRIFEATNVVFRKEHVDSIDVASRCIRARSDAGNTEIRYDVLVLAPGSETNTFGTRGVAAHAFFMREVGDAVAVRNQIIDCFERAARESDAAKRRALLSFVVVGAGPTGVELASEVRDLVAHVLLRRYPEIDGREVKVVVVQSGDGILPGWNPALVRHATERLRELEVDLRFGARVTAIDAEGVTLANGEHIEARTSVWCAGVKPSGLLQSVNLRLHPTGRVPIAADLRAVGQEHVFVLGDAAHLEADGVVLPPLGQVAFQQGAHCARNIERLLDGRPTRKFRYFDFGALVSVGEHFAAVDLLGLRFSGFIAWLVWRALYLAKLVGFGNRVRVLLDWSLDLLVERSISQIAATRQDLVERDEAGARLAERALAHRARGATLRLTEP